MYYLQCRALVSVRTKKSPNSKIIEKQTINKREREKKINNKLQRKDKRKKKKKKKKKRYLVSIICFFCLTVPLFLCPLSLNYLIKL